MMRHGIFALVTVSMFLIASVPPAGAQEQTVGEDPVQQLPEISFEGEVTVTGSLIPRADLTSMSPVSVMEIPQELTYSGTVRIEDLIKTMPQIFVNQNSTVANGASGTATIELRYLGAWRTLVLINGRRLSPGDAAGSYGADLHVVPASMVKRVDVLTGGASTVYGSDAVAGVVNFILDTDFDGVRGGLQYSFYNHDNNNPLAQEINRAAGFDPPTGMTNDGGALNANVALGGKFADGKGHAAVYLDYRKIDELRRGDRDYSYCYAEAEMDGLNCGGSPTNERGVFLAYNADGSFNDIYTLNWQEDGGDGHSFRPWEDEYYNWAASNHIQRPDEKYNAGAFANYEINKHFDAYIEVMYMNDSTDAEIAPSGDFGVTSAINCDNPMLSQQQHELICSGAGYADDEYATVYTYRRSVEGGPRTSQLGHTNIRMIAGLRGEINDEWSYDFYWLKAQNNQQESYLNDLNTERIGNALDVIEDPDTGEWVCRSGSDDGCVPWNVFAEGAVTQESIEYMSTVAVMTGLTSTQVVNLTLTSDWGNYGLAIPSASEGVQIAVGAEYREEKLSNQPDEVFLTGNRAGSGGPTPKVDGRLEVKEAFVELLVPVVQDARGARDLSLELGYRYSDYSTAGGVSTYKGQLSYAPTTSWRLRGGYNRAIRAANINELFEPQTISSLGGGEDICAGENPLATVEQCERTGVPAQMYGQVLENPLGGYNSLEGGNPFLEPEIADTITAGVVWTPQSIRGLSITLDYYDIEIAEAVGSLGADILIQLCAETNDPRYCNRVHRDEQFTLWLTEDGYTDATNQNFGSVVNEGIDLNFNYLLSLGSSGFLAMDLMGTFLLQARFSDPVVDYDCTGYFAGVCGFPSPFWRHRFRATWESSFRFNLSLGWRYINSVEIADASSNPQMGWPEGMPLWEANDLAVIPAYNWFDLAASYTFRNGIKLTAGVNNILDTEPPLYWEGYNIYDPLGRYVFSSVQFNF